MRQNVPRPGQVHSGTMKRPGMNFSGTKYVVAFVIFIFQKSESRNISETSTNNINRTHKIGTSYADALRY